MSDVRVENEIKMFSSGGPFAYEGNDPSESMRSLLSIFSSEGFTCSEPVTLSHTDYYYSDTKGEFDAARILLRFRDEGSRAYLTLKMPTVRNGLGLSRREIEGEIVHDSRFDRWKQVQDYANEFYGPVEIARVPRLKEEVVRGRSIIRSEVRSYEFSFDRMVYIDPVSGIRSVPCYELEFEVLDQAIGDDPQMVRLLEHLSDRYLFEEERVSKYARGMAFIASVRQSR